MSAEKEKPAESGAVQGKSLADFRLTPGSSAFFLAQFEGNAAKRFRITLQTGENIIGIPTIRSIDDVNEPRFLLRSANGDFHSIEISAVRVAEEILENDDAFFMGLAIEEARASVAESGAAPKPLVGAVLVQDGSIVAKARRGSLKAGEHAEYTLLDKLLENRVVAGSTLYTTLEPCTKRGAGKEPCAERIVARKINRVVIGMLDPNQDICGKGIWLLRESGIEVGLCGPAQMAQIEDINRAFVKHHRGRK